MCGWVLGVVHCCITPSIIQPRKHVDDPKPYNVGPYDFKGPSDDVSPPHDADDAQHMQMITIIMDSIMGLVNPEGEVYTLAL